MSACSARQGVAPSLLLRVSDLHVPDPLGRLLLAGVSFDVAAGERIAIVGPNGAGKTTLLRALADGVPPAQGQVTFEGRPIHAIARSEQARHAGMVSQTDNPDPRFIVRDYAALGRIPHAARATASSDRAVVEGALRTCGVDRFATRQLGSLSGGERQRVLLARALAQQPRLLLVDEPTNHLDLRARAEMLALLRGLGITVVAVLHDLPLVPGFADRVLVLKGGRLVSCGPPDRALSPDVVRDVFDLDCFPARGPDGRSHLVFDARVRDMVRPG